MPSALVINHGTLSSTVKDSSNLLTQISKMYGCTDHGLGSYYSMSANLPVVTTPGFGTDEFVYKLRHESGKITAAVARFHIHEAASWLWGDLQKAMMGGDPNLLGDIIFIGWSRGAILTWYQIYNLRTEHNSNANFHVLAIDPCYGPHILKHEEIPQAQDTVRRKWEISMMFQLAAADSLKSALTAPLLPPYPSNDPVSRMFLPGRHGSPVDPNDRYGDIYSLARELVGQFIARCNAGFQQYFHLLPNSISRACYARCKVKDKSMNYSVCYRPCSFGL